MFQIDDITLIAGAAVLLLTVLSLVLSPYIYKVALQEDDEEHEDEQQPEPEMPGISIILTPHDNAFELERYLPLYLEQEYARLSGHRGDLKGRERHRGRAEKICIQQTPLCHFHSRFIALHEPKEARHNRRSEGCQV